MGKINILDTEISNKIAAGEVVERPASVVKELVENSIDAGANLISVEIKKGGGTYLQVSDNGSGMSGEDAKICFLRHATSKIQKSEDLDAIYTLGFRGEALSSIGAVAQVSLYTKRAEDENGICVTCRGGEILSSEDAGIPDGTSVIVENLFYNTPARLKFLKKDNTESGYITDIMTRFIFAHPEISFRLTADGKEKLFSPGDGSLKNSLYTVYGKDYANGTIPVNYELENIKVSGLIGKGTLSRPKRNYQSFFVNGRYINSRTLVAALENAYKNQIMIGKFPMAALNIEIDPSRIDINVHPTKLEVKFSDEKSVYNAVYYAAKNALYEIPNVPKIERTGDNFKNDGSNGHLKLSDLADRLDRRMDGAFPKSMAGRPETAQYNQRMNRFMKGGAGAAPEDAEVKKTKPDFIKPKISPDDLFQQKFILNSPETQNSFFESESAKTEDIANTEANVFIDEYFEIVGQVFDSFIIAEKGDEMLLVDQHAAHERLKYEELKAEIESKEPISQLLIEPEIVNLSAGSVNSYRENAKAFAGMGFEIEEFGEDSLIVRAAPGGVEAGDVEPLILELIAQCDDLKKELITDTRQRLLYTVACKSAVKANMKMSEAEMQTLVRNVLRLKNINTCPHGRPIIITMSRREIEKEFKRIV